MLAEVGISDLAIVGFANERRNVFGRLVIEFALESC
jgi:hypothetical protein